LIGRLAYCYNLLARFGVTIPTDEELTATAAAGGRPYPPVEPAIAGEPAAGELSAGELGEIAQPSLPYLPIGPSPAEQAVSALMDRIAREGPSTALTAPLARSGPLGWDECCLLWVECCNRIAVGVQAIATASLPPASRQKRPEDPPDIPYEPLVYVPGPVEEVS